MDPLKDDSDATLSSSGSDVEMNDLKKMFLTMQVWVFQTKVLWLIWEVSQYYSPQNKEDAAGGICVEETNY